MNVEPALAHLAISNHGLRNSGGIERYALTLVGGLHRRGLRPTLIAKRFDRALPEYAWVEPVRADVRLAPGKLRDLFFDWRIGRIKRRLGLHPLIGCNQTRWSDIAICGGTHPGFLEATAGRAGLTDRWKIALEGAHLRGAAVVVAHSARMRDEAMRFYGVDAAKVRLLYPPVDAARFAPVDDAERRRLRAALGLADDRAVFLLASTGHRRKGLDRLLRFFTRTELPVLLLVAGRPVESGLRNVRALGYRSDIENVYRAVDFSVMASLYEPFGLVGIESALCGTPVVLADGVGCAEVLRPPAALAFRLADEGSLGAAIDAALERWKSGMHRLRSPLRHIGYDPGVDAHVEALLALARSLGPAR